MKQDSGIELFQLIRSLSKSEKRLVNLRLKNSHLSSKSQLHKLFIYLSGIKEYHYTKLERNYTNSTFLKHYASAKFKLTEIILQELVESQSGKLAADKNEQYLRHIKFLMGKNLFQSAWKLIKRIKKHATQQQDFDILSRALFFEKLIYPYLFRNAPAAYISKISKLESMAIKSHRVNQETFALLHLLITQGLEQFRIPDEYILQGYKNQFEILGSRCEGEYIPEQAHFYMIAISALLKQFEAHHDEAATLFSKAFEYVRKHPSAIFNLSILFIRLHYFSIMNNLLHNDIDKAKDWLKQMKSIQCKSKLSHVVYHEMFLLSNAYIYLYDNAFEKLNSINSQLSTENRNNYSLYFNRHYCFIMMLRYLKLRRYGVGLFWLNELKQSKKSDFAKDIIKLLRIFELIFHFELNNLGTINYLLRSTQRYLAKTKSIYPYEIILHRFATDIIRTLGKKQFYYHIDIVNQSMVQLMKENPNQPFGIEHILLWINQSLQNVPSGFKKLSDA